MQKLVTRHHVGLLLLFAAFSRTNVEGKPADPAPSTRKLLPIDNDNGIAAPDQCDTGFEGVSQRHAERTYGTAHRADQRDSRASHPDIAGPFRCSEYHCKGSALAAEFHPRVLCKRLGRDSEIYPCEDFGHVLEYMMSSIEHDPEDTRAWGVLRDLTKFLSHPVLTKADELIIAIAKLGEDVAQQLGVFSSVSTSNEPELETSTVLGIPIKLLKPSTTMLGMTRWGASTVLEDHLSQIVNKAYAKFSGLNILELGSGRGELAIALAKHGANVILSDYHHLMLRTLRNNVKANGLEAQTNVRVHHLDWANRNAEKILRIGEEGEIPFLAEGKTIDYVIGSDLIYSAEGGVLLGNLLVALASLPTTSNATFVFVYRHRDEDADRGVLSFFERVEPYFQIEIVQGHTRKESLPFASSQAEELAPAELGTKSADGATTEDRTASETIEVGGTTSSPSGETEATAARAGAPARAPAEVLTVAEMKVLSKPVLNARGKYFVITLQRRALPAHFESNEPP